VDITEDDPSSDSFYSKTLLELDELIGRIGPIQNRDVAYLLNFWRWFSIYQTEPAVSVEAVKASIESESTPLDFPQVTRVKKGWNVLDYGDGLITSAGADYGIASTGPLLETVKYMVARLVKRGATAVFFAGALPAKRFAWIECARFNIDNRFSPDEQDTRCREGLVKILQGKFYSFQL
jgi:hypothetical protein